MNKTKAINMICFLFVVVFMAAMNSQVRYMTDDWHYRYLLHDPDYEFVSQSRFRELLPDANERLVSSFSDVLRSAKNQYLTIGGRVVNHFFIILLLFLADKWLFNIINSIMFALLGYFIYRIAAPDDVGKRAKLPWLLPFIYLLEFTLPQIGDNVFWMAGAVNYLWPSVIMTGTLLFMKRYFFSQKKLPLLPMFLLMLLASSTNEVSGGMMGVALFFWFVSDKDRKKRVPRYAISVLLFISGELIVLIAPGNFNRATKMNQVELGNISDILNSSTAYLRTFLTEGKYLIWVTVLFVLIFYPVLRRKDIFMFSFAIAGLAGSVAFGLSSTYFDRIVFYPIVQLYVTAAICLVRAYEQLNDPDGFDVIGQIRAHWLRTALIFAAIEYVRLSILSVSNLAVYFMIFLWLFLWVLAYCRRERRCRLREFDARGWLEYIYKRAPLFILTIAPLPGVYRLIFGRYSTDAALHYVVEYVKAAAAMSVLAMIVWVIRHDKLEKPKSEKLIKLTERFSPSRVSAYFGSYKRTQLAKLYRGGLLLTSVYLICFTVYSAACAVPYFVANKKVWDGIAEKAAAGEKVIEYEYYPSIGYGHKTSFCTKYAIMDINSITGSWAEVYYDITLVGYGDQSHKQKTLGERRLNAEQSAKTQK